MCVFACACVRARVCVCVCVCGRTGSFRPFKKISID